MPAQSVFRASPGRLYVGLILLRVLFAFLGTGYIHPDEYFQNGEITAGKVFMFVRNEKVQRCPQVRSSAGILCELGSGTLYFHAAPSSLRS